ncbi:MAG TPA: TIGR02186 family protein [Hyphomicrobiaceae bacterium]|nr:TIGR02186 family protein [Hyphomicrobiaceae bacterium]
MLPAVLSLALLAMLAPDALAQKRQKAAPAPSVAKEAPHTQIEEVKREQQPGAKESVQADVSARNVAVTSSFNGIEIVIFGAVDNSQQPSAESGIYDVLIVVEGVPGRIVVRRKNNVAGLWLNTASATFDLVPSYYAIASTRPIDEITSEEFRASHGVGFQHLRFTPAFGQSQALSTEDLKEFREAIVRLKEKQGLYIQNNFRVAFIGRSLFRATIELPANVTVGPFDTRVYLFRDEKLLSQYSVRLNLEREGVERHLHRFAFSYPTLYGLATVALAVAAGLIASAVFRKNAH